MRSSPRRAGRLISLKVPTALLERMDSVASTEGHGRSSFVRNAIVSDLTRRGLWPPKAPADAK